MKEFTGIWIPDEVLVDKNLNDKEKTIFSMILSLSKENDCIMSNSYISKLLNICNVQASRIINSLKKKGYINVQIIRKENLKEIAYRKIAPINRKEKNKHKLKGLCLFLLKSGDVQNSTPFVNSTLLKATLLGSYRDRRGLPDPARI